MSAGDTMTGALGVVAGSASAPGVFFSGDTNTGLLAPAADSVAITTGGLQRILVDSSGNVGIGSASPASLGSGFTEVMISGNTEGAGLQLQDEVGNVKAGIFTSDNSNTATVRTITNHPLTFRTNNTEALRIDSAGRVGIGTSNASESLEVAGNGLKVSGQTSSVTDEGITFDWDSGNNNGRIFSESAGSSNLLFYTTSSGTRAEAMRIDSAGRLGLGTSSPSQRLNLNIGGDQTWLQIDKTRAADEAMIQLVHSATNRGSKIRYANADSSWVVGIDGSESFVFTSGEVATGGGGTERMRIDSSGRLGLGTSSPGSYSGASTQLSIAASGNSGLNIVSGTTNTGIIRFADGTSGDAAYRGRVEYMHDVDALMFGTAGVEQIRIDGSGRLLVGTSSGSGEPIAAFQGRSNDASDSGIVAITRTGTNPSGSIGELRFATGSDFNKYYGMILCASDGSTSSTSLPGALRFSTTASGSTSPTERMRIDSSGRLLVGTSTSLGDGSPLQVVNDTANPIEVFRGQSTSSGPVLLLNKSRGSTASPSIVIDNDQTGSISFKGYDGSNYIDSAQIRGFVNGTPGANSMPGRLVFSTTASGSSTPTERMRLDSSGRLLVGTSSQVFSNFALHVVSSASACAFKEISGNSANNLQVNWHTATSGNNRFIEFGTEGGFTNRGDISYNRSGNTVGLNSASDARLKTNIADASSALNVLNQVQVRTFDWIEEGHDTVAYGFIAQELNDVVPSAVSIGDSEDQVVQAWGVDKAGMVPMLTKALQEAIAKIETLEAKVAALEAG